MQKTILTIANKNDDFCKHLEHAASKKNLRTINLCPEDFFDKIKVEFNISSGGSHFILKSGKKEIGIENVLAVFPRITNFTGDPKLRNSSNHIYTVSEWNSFYKGWLASLSIPVINLISPEYWQKQNLNPIDLNEFSSKLKLHIPAYIISNDSYDLKNFFLRHKKNVRFVSNSHAKVSYKIDTESDFKKLSHLGKYFPITLHQLPKGISYEVFYVGENTYTIDSQGKLSGAVPKKFMNDIFLISRKTGLRFASFEVVASEKKFFLTSVSMYPCFSRCSKSVVTKILNGLFENYLKI
ncbi:MAG: hypothetical protein ABIY50_04110 [Ignavibacteria bacterium]